MRDLLTWVETAGKVYLVAEPFGVVDERIKAPEWAEKED
jgi:hypothetical protein